jgi:hypothetical protein
MATLLGTSIKIPFEPGKGIQEHDRLFEEIVGKAAAEARAKRPGEYVGEVIHFGVADGSASYMVVSEKPLNLQHIDYLDGYRVPFMMIRGLRLQDVQDMVEQNRRMRELFSKRNSK